MCGICGIIRTSGVQGSEIVAMNTIIRHRGPDDEGFLFADENVTLARGNDTHPEFTDLPHAETLDNQKLALGHRRLSIIDLSPGGHQPMRDQHGYLSFNGEIYNYQELKKGLESAGESFASSSDSEILLRKLLRQGESAVPDLRGMWGFSYYDSSERSLLVSRDRFGIKPIYYVSKPGFFAFASEMKALLLLAEVTPELDQKAALEFLVYGEITNPEDTLYKDIKRLAPGHNLSLSVDDPNPRITQYYDLVSSSNGKQIRSQEEANEMFAEVFDASIREHCIADVEVGACLSGGLDSSAVCLSGARNLSLLKSFTAIFPGTDVNEEGYARQVTDTISNAEAYYVQPEPEHFMTEVDAFMGAQEYPVNSLSPYAQFKVMDLAAQQRVKVLLDGQGADEILGGYYHFVGIYLIEYLKRMRLGAFSKNYRLLKQNFTDNMGQALMRSAFFFMPSFIRTAGRKKLRLSAQVLADDFMRGMRMTESPDRSGKNYRDTSLAAIKYGLQTLLRYEDLNSMHYSIESRVPFLDHRLVELAINMPSEYKVSGGYTKYVLRKYMDKKLPDPVVWRKDKIGFVVPQNDWKSALLDRVKEQFHSADLPPIFERKRLIDIADANLNNKAVQSEFWRIYSFINWWNKYHVH